MFSIRFHYSHEALVWILINFYLKKQVHIPSELTYICTETKMSFNHQTSVKYSQQHDHTYTFQLGVNYIYGI